MAKHTLLSWGGVQRADYEVLAINDRFANLPALTDTYPHMLPYGNGRSYGDSCLNIGGALLKTRQLDRFIHFDSATGILACEAGTLLADISRLTVPHGWFHAVTPGTSFVTVGGAIANDVHGKNHHRLGTFGRHVTRFELLRTDGSRFICSPTENPEWFAATIGGLGLTGLITWAEIQLRHIDNALIDAETIRFSALDDFFALCAESDSDYEYTVAWIDCACDTKHIGRGLFTRGNHSRAIAPLEVKQTRRQSAPFEPPFSLVNAASIKAFNAYYYKKQKYDRQRQTQHYETFFYPLDGINNWNKIYGPKGFFQYQCVVPIKNHREIMTRLLATIAQSNQRSFLAVLKLFGNFISPGMLSFPQPGVTLAVDFANCGNETTLLFERLDAIVSEAGGRLYPAKDARMSGHMFRQNYPEWEKFSQFIDPQFSSSFWRRVMSEI